MPARYVWSRWAARWGDSTIFVGVYSYVIILCMRWLLELIGTGRALQLWEVLALSLGTVFVAILCWLLTEAVLISMFGTTPCKSWLGIYVHQQDGSNPEFITSIRRVLRMYLVGYGLGIPPVSLIAMLIAYTRLAENGTTWWDVKSGTVVRHWPIGVWRTVSYILTMIAVIVTRTQYRLLYFEMSF